MLTKTSAKLLANRQQVGERLAGVGVVGQRVDDGDVAVGRQFLDVLVVVDAGHDEVDVPGKRSGGVLDRLAVAQVDVVRSEEDGVAAQLCHPRLEGDPRSGRGFLEDHPQRLLVEQVARVLAGWPLDRCGAVQDGGQFLGRQVVDVEQMHG